MMSDSQQKLGRKEWNAYMEKVKARDKDAFSFVFRFYAPKLKQFAYKHVGNEHPRGTGFQRTGIRLALLGQSNP